MLELLLSNSIGINLQLQRTTQQKLDFVDTVMSDFAWKCPEIALKAVTKKFYAPYTLAKLIERDVFMRQTDNYESFNACLENSSVFELEELSKIQEIEERFMKFIKYIDILDKDDVKKIQGEKLREKIFSIHKFTQLQNESLKLFDQPSMILDEDAPVDADDVGEHRVHIAIQGSITNGKQRSKEIDYQ